MPAVAPTRARVTALLQRSRKKITPQERVAILDQLIDVYATLAPGDGDVARDVRRAFLLTLQATPEILQEERVAAFLADHIEPEDFAELPWQTPAAVIAYCELLYRFRVRSDTMATHLQALERNLLRYALQQYEHHGAYEKMFQLLKLAPTSPALTDAELQRLRNRAYLYELRRVQRNRRWLAAYLLVQVALIVLVCPVLFLAAESGALQQWLAAVTPLDLPPEAPRAFSYWEALYWSVITAASIGYGDITPVTTIGRILAAALGVLGVITIGVIGGLILGWISQRSLD